MVNRPPLLLLYILLFGICQPFELKAQWCDKRKLCNNELLGSEEYKYEEQSGHFFVAPGDTIRFKAVLYSRNKYRIFLCPEKNLGNIDFKIYTPENVFKRVLKEVNWNVVPIFQSDGYGGYLKDENGNNIKIGELRERDTIWNRQIYEVETLIFDSKKILYPIKIFSEYINHTKLIVIEVVVPPNEKRKSGCLSFMIGNIYTGKAKRQLH